MGKDLIIVESPAKVKTIKKFLGNAYAVEASVGHVRDLPSKNLGVDEDQDFAPHYQIIPGKQKVVSKLKEAAAHAGKIYLAPDPDREGEAIAWHVAELLKDADAPICRIQFNEITARAVREALSHPREINEKLFLSQQARRILDRTGRLQGIAHPVVQGQKRHLRRPGPVRGPAAGGGSGKGTSGFRA